MALEGNVNTQALRALRALEGHLGTQALEGHVNTAALKTFWHLRHLGTRRALGDSFTLGTLALGHLATQALTY